uniref:GON-4-like protein n=1 Tax=Clastoptera arizonana TaxID=38151 RepID=A0A1B6CB21_9HEMI
MSEKKIVGSTPKKRKKALTIKKGRKIPKFMDELVDEEIERELDLKAEKNNLTVVNVKNIIKSVITNKDVLKMVNQSLNGEVGCLYEPKLTRAKTKELLQKDPNAALHPVLTLTPVKSVSSPVVKVFIDNELSEDSSDDEYNPNEEEEPVSDDDDKDVSNSVASDLDSLPLTPASALVADVPDPDLLDEGLFVKPQENVGQRTRSKLSLSSTPLEVIEQSFIPPDITHDMYETACENEDWADFLKEFCQPLDNIGNETLDDIDADPEYNVLADEDAEEVDKEELRMDRGVRVSRKELNSLISELMEYTDIMNNELDNTENLRNSTIDKSLLQDELQDSVREQPTAYQKNELHEEQLISKEGIDFKTILSFTPEQQLLLSQQMRQHIQLLTQHFLQTYNHPILHRFSSKCKESLVSYWFFIIFPFNFLLNVCLIFIGIFNRIPYTIWEKEKSLHSLNHLI